MRFPLWFPALFILFQPLFSTDGGQTWQLQKHEVPARQIFFFDGESVIGSGGG